MRSILIGLMTLFCSLFGVAQSITPSVTNLSGFDGTANKYTITSSIGESVITTLISDGIILTQGFLQPETPPCLDVVFSYYPNPAPEEITVSVSGCDVEIESIQLFDLWGRLIPTITLGKNNKVKLIGLSQGVYLMQVLLSNGTSNSVKIFKVD